MDGLLNSPEARDTMYNYSIAPVTSFQPGHKKVADPNEQCKHSLQPPRRTWSDNSPSRKKHVEKDSAL